MRNLVRLSLLIALAAAAAAAQPTILGLQNNYSYLIPDTPNYAFAQGGILVIYGTDMAPAGLLTGAFDPALDPNLGGVSIQVAVAGVTTQAIPYYVSPTQISAILPSATPVGQGAVTVAFNGQTSAPFPIQVVPGAFGLLTMSGNGLGQAVVQDANFGYLTPANAAQPNQVVIFWGTGLGADPNDETRLIAAPQSLAGPFQLYIGGKPAEVLYHGRSQFPGLDQVVARVPADVSGCFVAVYAKTGQYVSNFTTIPVSPGGGCSDPFVSSADAERFATLETVVSGRLSLGFFSNYNPGGTTAGSPVPPGTVVTESAVAQFLRYTAFNYLNYGAIGQPSFGGCTGNAYQISPFVIPFLEDLDAGAMSIDADGVSFNMQKYDFGYSVSGGVGLGPFAIPDAGRTATFVGAGGTQVGPFSAPVTVPADFVWNEQRTLSEIDRSQDLTLTWTGGSDAPGAYVVVTGTALDPDIGFTQFACTILASAGRITIPADVLSSMIPSYLNPGSTVPTGQLLVYNYAPAQPFTADGVDNGYLSYYASFTTVLNYR